jgi:hypothetical protein
LVIDLGNICSSQSSHCKLQTALSVIDRLNVVDTILTRPIWYTSPISALGSFNGGSFFG